MGDAQVKSGMTSCYPPIRASEYMAPYYQPISVPKIYDVIYQYIFTQKTCLHLRLYKDVDLIEEVKFYFNSQTSYISEIKLKPLLLDCRYYLSAAVLDLQYYLVCHNYNWTAARYLVCCTLFGLKHIISLPHCYLVQRPIKIWTLDCNKMH